MRTSRPGSAALPPVLFRLVLLALVLVVSAACAGGGSSPAGAAAGPSPSSTDAGIFAAAANDPCALVAPAEAQAILGHAVAAPQVGPPGTCDYLEPVPTDSPAGRPPARAARGAKAPSAPGDTGTPVGTPAGTGTPETGAVTLTLADVTDVAIAESVIPAATRVEGLPRPGVCGEAGTGAQMLFVPFDNHHLLEVVGPSCATDIAFAARALTRL